MALDLRNLGVCSWSLQVTSVPELKGFLDQLGLDLVQIACGDPHHASWDEGDALPTAAKAAGFRMGGAMLGFPGEDYTTPASIQRTGGFGDPATRPERLDRLRWAVARTVELGLTDLMFHAGFIPPPGDAGRSAFLDTLATAAGIAGERGVTVAFETGQETADLLHRTLTDLAVPNARVNFDPANMLLYDMGDPLAAVDKLAQFIRSVHLKDATRPTTPGEWGREVPIGEGQTQSAAFLTALDRAGYAGPVFIEREVGDRAGRLRDIAHAADFVRAWATGRG
jgi:sugar phosphate isomerase/epimerase